MDYGMKVSRPGYDVKTAEPYELAFSSKYQTLKVHSQHSGQIYDSTGRTAIISHGLGYVPMFFVHGNPYWETSGRYFLAPFVENGTILWPGQSHFYAYADSSNIYIKVSDDFGWYGVSSNGAADCFSAWWTGFGGGCVNGRIQIGRDATYETEYGAVRFLNIARAKSANVYRARLAIRIGTRSGSSTIPVKLWGINEDNCPAFGCGPTMGLTTANYTESIDGSLGSGSVWATDVTNIFNEIINRGAWSSGNAMGFIIRDNGASATNDIWSFAAYETGETAIRWLPQNLLLNYKCTIYKNKII